MSTDQAKLHLDDWPETVRTDLTEDALYRVLLIGSDEFGEFLPEHSQPAASSEVDRWVKYGALLSGIPMAEQTSEQHGDDSSLWESRSVPRLLVNNVYLSHSSTDEEAIGELYDSLDRMRCRIFGRPGEAGMSIFMDVRDVETSAGGTFAAAGEVSGSLRAESTHVAYHDAYQARILELREVAEDDEDIEEINEDSIREFWTFMESAGFDRRAGLVLQDNGNLRAVWRDKAGHNVGLEFQGGRSILYVMFKPYTDGRKTFREADVATFDDVVDKLRELDLLTFVSA